MELIELKTELSKEWNKPKIINKKWGKQEIRSYKKIFELQEQIDKIKNPIIPEEYKKNIRIFLNL